MYVILFLKRVLRQRRLRVHNYIVTKGLGVNARACDDVHSWPIIIYCATHTLTILYSVFRLLHLLRVLGQGPIHARPTR